MITAIPVIEVHCFVISESDQVGVQSLEILKVRAVLGERLKQEGILSSRAPKPDKAKKLLKPVNGPLMTFDDFDDDAIDVGATRFSNGHASSLSTMVSGDDDLPKRVNIGERQRKHELQVLAGAGVKSEDDVGDEVDNFEVDGDIDMGDGDTAIQEIQKMNITNQLNKNLLPKLKMYSRTSAVVSSSPVPIDGKRHITYQMEKNRGLTQKHKKQTKNCRKYKEQHKKK
ncbi:hypothetical protein CMV_012838 [Castanea mollissima]|uniref:Sas10 C-terminal domain-containing protein n=1 Tax=Castanea mollissima TaxID=60419 RepID=A0A8J4RGC2_9ROSI|nr:hypothetical protein CMV_012838 [Castanea mollissima]